MTIDSEIIKALVEAGKDRAPRSAIDTVECIVYDLGRSLGEREAWEAVVGELMRFRAVANMAVFGEIEAQLAPAIRRT